MAFLVQSNRVEWAAKTVNEKVPDLEEDIILELADEIGLSECISYTSDAAGFQFEMTDLQMVAFAAALHAVWEVRVGAARAGARAGARASGKKS